jgi:hypothetical protein
MPSDRFYIVTSLLWLLASIQAGGQTLEWHPVTHGPGLSFQIDVETRDEHSCLLRFREERKLRRTTSDLAVTYSFQRIQRLEKYKAHFEARDSDSLYLMSCDGVVDVVATTLRRW